MELLEIKTILYDVREKMESEYGTGTDLCGACIEASDLIVERLQEKGINSAHYVEGWCLYDDGSWCSDVPYDPHTWVEFVYDGAKYYADVTADQFNYGMSEKNKFAPVILCVGLPHGMQVEEPIDDCEEDEYD